MSQLFDPAPPRPPAPPWTIHSQTSQDAAFAIKQVAAAQREDVFRAIAESSDGLTDLEIQKILGLSGDSERPRRVELHQRHRIKEAGKRRTDSGRFSSVWVVDEAH